MTPSCWARAGASAMLVSVAAGAFGAHGLRARLSPEMLAIWETGARYMAYHGLGLLFVSWLSEKTSVGAAGWLFSAGIVLFSGSLLLLALTGKKWLGAITPLGGLCFLAGWAVIAFRKW
jgi:uncharacterized membrane protein YgdD (TMEM256/DUF423 family)